MRDKTTLGVVAAPSVALLSNVEALFRREYEPMYRLAFTMLGHDRDAEEVVQDAFVGVASHWNELENPGGYLRVSVVNGTRKRMRSTARRTATEIVTDADVLGSESTPSEYLLDVLDSLTERQRVAVVLTYYSGLNSTEVGDVMDCPAATVRSLVNRALTQLRREVPR
jgi:RNA polymerase sigma-70 factor (ECF subfamily)